MKGMAHTDSEAAGAPNASAADAHHPDPTPMRTDCYARADSRDMSTIAEPSRFTGHDKDSSHTYG
ncbi:hypothetical protein DEI95_08185 [Curtobacterium sp. MCBD17_008]|nr:hypothetical protein DEI95_08185 [Curtobacterium sp. MCBD17_008]